MASKDVNELLLVSTDWKFLFKFSLIDVCP